MKKNSFLEGALIATLGIVFVKFLGIIYVIPFYSIIGEKGGALYGYAYSVYTLFLNMTTIGISLAVSKLTSEYETLGNMRAKDEVYALGKKMMLMVGFFGFIAIFLFSNSLAELFIGEVKGGNTQADVAFVLRIISTALLVVPILSVSKGYLQGHRFMVAATKGNVIEQLVRVVIIVLGSYLTVSVLGYEVKYGVGVATFAATIGAAASYLYIHKKIKDNRKYFEQVHDENSEPLRKRQIIVRILGFSIPFAISAAIISLYNIVDLATILKTSVNKLAYTAEDGEAIVSILTTWGAKLSMIVVAISTGVITSIVPSLTESYTRKDEAGVSNKINKAIEVILFVSIPMAVMLSLLSPQVWTIFYKYDPFASDVFKVSILVSIFISLMSITNAIMQTLNKQMIMMAVIIIGVALKTFLNIPLMILADKLGFIASHGANLATAIGFTTSILIMGFYIKNKFNVKYRDSITSFFKIMLATIVMIIAVLGLYNLFPYHEMGKFLTLIHAGVFGLFGVLVYGLVSYKLGLVSKIFEGKLKFKIFKK